MPGNLSNTRNGAFWDLDQGNERPPHGSGAPQPHWAPNHKRDCAQSALNQKLKPHPVLYGGGLRRPSEDSRCVQPSPMPQKNPEKHHRHTCPTVGTRLRGGPLPDDKSKEPRSGSAPRDGDRSAGEKKMEAAKGRPSEPGPYNQGEHPSGRMNRTCAAM